MEAIKSAINAWSLHFNTRSSRKAIPKTTIKTITIFSPNNSFLLFSLQR